MIFLTALIRKIAIVVCIVTLLATPLMREVFAQSETSTPFTTGTVNSATSSENTTASEVSAKHPWYKSDWISGNPEVGDFVVGPGRSELEVNPGETVVQEIIVTNRISADRTFKLEVEDITGSADASTAVTLTGDERGPYSIRDYISFPENTFTLSLGERAHIPVTITVPPDAEPGGYYGSVLVSTVQNSNSDAPNAPRSPLIARVGSLIFLRVKGDTKVEGKSLGVSLINDKWWYEKGPIELGVLYENTGSVHVNPYGELLVTNIFGEEVGFIELGPWFVLPSSMRLREVTWDREFLLGRYTVTAKINRGYDDIIDESSVSFWVLPWKVVGGVFLALFIIFFLFRAFFRTFEFKRKSA